MRKTSSGLGEFESSSTVLLMQKSASFDVSAHDSAKYKPSEETFLGTSPGSGDDISSRILEKDGSSPKRIASGMSLVSLSVGVSAGDSVDSPGIVVAKSPERDIEVLGSLASESSPSKKSSALSLFQSVLKRPVDSPVTRSSASLALESPEGEASVSMSSSKGFSDAPEYSKSKSETVLKTAEVKDDEGSKSILDSSDVSLESFDLLKVLGKGSFGKVMLVRHRASGKLYAMKILKKSAIEAKNQIAHTLAERRVLTEMNHPFISKLHFAFQTETKLYLVMDFFQGGELFFHLESHRWFTEEQAKFMVAEVALAIGYLHSKGCIYRDLKPENLLMDSVGHVYLSDFGFAKFLKPEDSKTSTFCGAPEYMAPEVLLGKPYGKAVDWWSVGVLLYELFVGIPPFYSEDRLEMAKMIINNDLEFPEGASFDMIDLLVNLLNKDQDARLGSSEADVAEVLGHKFFSSIDLDKLLRKELDPLYKLKLQDLYDPEDPKFLKMFDQVFTSEPALDSPVSQSTLKDSKSLQEAFRGFEYTRLY